MEVPETVFTRVFYAASQVLQEALGDPQPPWDELPAWQQNAMVDVTRRCMMGATPEQLHTLWVQHYSAQGWTHGPEKNLETRQHPIIIPWHGLPLRYQARFKLWQAITATLMLEIPEYSAIHSLIPFKRSEVSSEIWVCRNTSAPPGGMRIAAIRACRPRTAQKHMICRPN